MTVKRYALTSIVFLFFIGIAKITLYEKLLAFVFLCYSMMLTFLYLEIIEPKLRHLFEKKYKTTLKRDITPLGIYWWPMGDPKVARNHWLVLDFVPMALLVSIMIGGGLVLLVPAIFVFSIG